MAGKSGAETLNPYAPPKAMLELPAGDEAGYELAGRGSRLAARIIDGLVCGIPVGLGRWLVLPNGFPGALVQKHPFLHGLLTSLLVWAAWKSLYLLINGRWLLRDGQTLGKSMLGIRIVRADGSAADLLDTFVKRELPIGLFQQIPFIGTLALLDPVFIFSKGRQCFHDHLAGTIVVVSSTWRPTGRAAAEPKAARIPKLSCPYCGERYAPGSLTCPACERDMTLVLDPARVNRTLTTAERLHKAHRLHAWGDHAEALELYELTAREDPDCLEAWRCILHTAAAAPALRAEAQAQVERLRDPENTA